MPTSTNIETRYIKELIDWENEKKENQLAFNFCCNSIRKKGGKVNSFVSQGEGVFNAEVGAPIMNANINVRFSDRDNFSGKKNRTRFSILVNQRRPVRWSCKSGRVG